MVTASDVDGEVRVRQTELTRCFVVQTKDRNYGEGRVVASMIAFQLNWVVSMAVLMKERWDESVDSDGYVDVGCFLRDSDEVKEDSRQLGEVTRLSGGRTEQWRGRILESDGWNQSAGRVCEKVAAGRAGYLVTT